MEGSNKKLYSQKGISIATFFGGPLAAGYLIRQNFIALGKEPEVYNPEIERKNRSVEVLLQEIEQMAL